jgi:hypothetical protein
MIGDRSENAKAADAVGVGSSNNIQCIAGKTS